MSLHTPPALADVEREIVEEFAFFDDWADRYAYLMDLGKKLPPLDPADCTEENRVRGCQSRVWLRSDLIDDLVRYRADSDAMITKGLIALLIRVLSGRPPAEIVRAPLTFIDEIGMRKHLSPNRSNGLNAMVRRMKADAARLAPQSPTLNSDV